MDYRNAQRITMLGLQSDENLLNFVPYLFSLHTLADDLVSVYDDSGNFIYPPVSLNRLCIKKIIKIRNAENFFE